MSTTFPVTWDGYGSILVIDGTTTEKSGWFLVEQYLSVSIHCMVTAATGTITFNCSNFDSPQTEGRVSDFSGANYTGLITAAIGTHFVTLANVKSFSFTPVTTSFTITAGSPAENLLEIDNAGWKWMRVVWTPTADVDGTLVVRIKGKRNKSSAL